MDIYEEDPDDEEEIVEEQPEEVVDEHQQKKRELLSLTSKQTPYGESARGPRVDPDLVDKVKNFEGYKSDAYWDVRQNTVGWGTRAKYPGEHITPDEAETRLSDELDKAARTVDRVNPDLSPGTRKALISLTMNAGGGWASDGLGQAVRSGDPDAIANKLVEYNKSKGRYNQGLQDRRNEEAKWIFDKNQDEHRPQRGPTTERALEDGDVEDLVHRLKGHTRDHIDGMAPELRGRLSSMISAAPPDIAAKIGIVSGYRSESRQAELYDAAVKKYGEAGARKWVAPPGRSQHNHGNAADLDFGDDPKVVQWVHDHAAEFGLKFPMGHEKWHVEISETRGGPKFGHSGQGVGETKAERSILARHPGEAPVSVSHTTEPETQQIIDEAANPSLLSTIMNYQELTADPNIKPPETAPQPPEPTWKDKLISTVNSFATEGKNTSPELRWGLIADLLNKPVIDTKTPIAEQVKELDQLDQNLTKGVVAGVASQPGQLGRSWGGTAATTIGQLTGNNPLTKWGIETSLAAEPAVESWKKDYKIDPNNPVSGFGFKVGENVGPGVVKTGLNLATASLADQYLGPAAKYLGENYPISSINPIGTAEAATVFGHVPIVVDTPAGQVVMNDADISQFVYGGVLAVGFGSAIPLVGKGIRLVRTAPALGLTGVFDPRRPIPGAQGTEAASLPIDKLKAGTLDQGKAMQDIARRQAAYDKGVKGGLDPIAANEVLQAWRIQTNSGAQNLIHTALTEGRMNASDEFKFDVKVSLGKLVEFEKADPNFANYLRLKIIEDEIAFRTRSNQSLPLSSKKVRKPEKIDDPIDNTIIYDANNVRNILNQMDTANPAYKRMYQAYRENLTATKDFVSTHPHHAVENAQSLTAKAAENPSAPLFAYDASTKDVLKRVLNGESPLSIAEDAMKSAMREQMKFDATMRYIKMTQQAVGDKAFTPRNKKWMETKSSAAEAAGAIISFRHNGNEIHYTADPLLVSIIKSGHIPLSGMEQTFAYAKYGFQKTTTGFFALWFPETGLIRSVEQGWTTAPGHVRNAKGKRVWPAGPISAAVGLGDLTRVKMLRPTAEFFRSATQDTILGKMLDRKQLDLIARTLEKAYMDSHYYRMKIGGAFSTDPLMEAREIESNIAQHRKFFGSNPQMNPVINWMESTMGMMQHLLFDPVKKGLYNPINAFNTTIQEAGAWGFTRKVLKGSDDTHRPTWQGRELTDAEVAEMAFKNYNGNPATRGYAYTPDGEPLKFDARGGLPQGLNKGERFLNHLGRATWGLQDAIIQKANAGAHWGRAFTPWSGVLFQSPSATLAAMRDNPWRANIAFAASAVMPEVVAYLWNSYWSDQWVYPKDENGDYILGQNGKPLRMKYDYVNYMMNLRNDYNLLNNTYFANPHKSPENGIEFRQYQEAIMNRYMTRAFMHQYAGKAYGSMGDDVIKGIQGFMGGAIIPPIPSPMGAFLGSKGLVATSGWTGALFKSRYNPYIELGGGESWTELVFRGLVPAIADITLTAWRAGTHTPEWKDVSTNVGKAVTNRILSKTALVGDAFGVKPDISGAPSISSDYWEDKRTIDDLSFRYRFWDVGQGDVNTKIGSKKGRAGSSDYMGELPPGAAKDVIENVGVEQPPPENPLYTMLMEEIEKKFNKDEPKKGGIGFKSMWGHYTIYGKLVSEMRTVNEGTAGGWVAKQLTNPERMQWLRERNVNPLDYKAVKDFYQDKRNKATQKVMQVIMAVEQDISERPEIKPLLKGQPFKIKMLDPTKPGIHVEQED